MKSIVIIGAGPAGLVTAKTFLRSQSQHEFKVTILEKTNRIGGLWAVDEHNRGILDYHMSTNLSKFTVCFSDLSWDSVDLSSATSSAPTRSSYAPMFPKAWQVERYLEKYAEMYIPKNIVRFNSFVTNAQTVQDMNQAKWKVSWKDSLTGSRTYEDTFDFMIVASGFFAAPRNLKLDMNTLPVVHSSELPSDIIHSKTKGNILVVGGGMSGAEAAASLALEISSRRFSPSVKSGVAKSDVAKSEVGKREAAESEVAKSETTKSEASKSEAMTNGATTNEAKNVIHVASRPFYAVPLFIPTEIPTETPANIPTKEQEVFLPLDLCFYDLSRRPKGPPALGIVPGKARSTHKYLSSVGDYINFDDLDSDQPPFVAIAENYTGFLQSGHIVPVKGRLVRLTQEDAGQTTALISDNGDIKKIENVIGLINATGFSPLPALSFLSSDVKNALEFDEKCLRLPFLLEDYYTSHPKFCNLGFVGFYEGPFWGVMEMQARLLFKKWTTFSGGEITSSDDEVDQSHFLRDLRLAMLRNDDSLPQYWMGDYMGIMENIAKEVSTERTDIWDDSVGPVLPARYTDQGCDSSEAEKTLKSLETMFAQAKSGQFVARAIFRALHGSWNMKRELESFIPNFPSGTFTGIARFHPRIPTAQNFAAEYLYLEEGTLVTKQGFNINANRRYVYRYNEESDKMSIWFVKDDGLTVDYLYHEIRIDSNKSLHWLANADHLCVEDMYTTAYDFCFKGIALERFEIQHTVKGPRKDYISGTWYQRSN